MKTRGRKESDVARRRKWGIKRREIDPASNQFPKCSPQPGTHKEIHRFGYKKFAVCIQTANFLYRYAKKNKFFRKSIIFSSRNEIGCFRYSTDKRVYIEINVTRMHRKLETIASKQ